MKKQLLPLAIGLLSITAVITSCKKDDDDPITPAQQICKIDYFTDEEYGDSSQFLYDAQNRISRTESYNADKSLRSYSDYTYSMNKIVCHTVFYNSDNTTIESEIQYHLNSDGLLQYESQTRDYGSNMNYDTTFYTYDSNGYAIRLVNKEFATNNDVILYASSDTTWYTYTNGNLTSERIKRQNSSDIITTHTYTNIEDKTHFFSNDMLSPGMNGKLSKNLIASSSNNENSDTDTYTYEINNTGLITRYTMVYTYGSNTDTNDLHLYYLCK